MGQGKESKGLNFATVKVFSLSEPSRPPAPPPKKKTERKEGGKKGEGEGREPGEMVQSINHLPCKHDIHTKGIKNRKLCSFNTVC